MKMKPLVLLATITLCSSARVSRQEEPDDAVVIESVGDGSSTGTSTSSNGDITPIDGPDGPSIIGSVDNVFKAIKDYDQYRCIERMLCEAMQEGVDGIPGLGTVVSAITGETGPPTSASLFGGPSESSLFGQSGGSFGGGGGGGGSFLDSFTDLFSGRRRRISPPPPRRFRSRPPPPLRRRRPRPQRRFIPSLRRTKRQTRLQGNLIRLMQATGMDTYNAFPYVRAALIGHATKNRIGGSTRRQSSCSQLYRECPTDPDKLLNYLNNHNGGLIGQVQPSVDNEVAPIIQAIVADMVGEDESTSSATGEGSLFEMGDAFLTNALINGAQSVFTDGIPDSLGSVIPDGLGSVIPDGLGSVIPDGLASVVNSIVGKKKKK